MSKIEFSQKALERSNRNSSNYVLSSVRSRWTWLLLGATSLFFGAMVFWGFYGSMAVSVSGVGITMLSYGSRPVIAAGTGTISHLNIESGAHVKADQVIGQIYNAETFFNIQKIESEYNLLKEQIEAQRKGIDELALTQREVAEKKQKYLEHMAGEYELAKQRSNEVADIYARLKKIDAVSVVSYYESLDQRLQTEASMISSVLQNLAAEIEAKTLFWENQQKFISLEQQLRAKEHELRLAENLYQDAFWIRSEFTGTVREVLKENGAFVQMGEKIALVDSNSSSGIYLIAFVPAADSKKIRNGMGAFFAPSAISANDHGYIRCIVREVSQQPNTAESIQAQLMNSSLTQMVAGKAVMTRVVLELIPDKRNVSRYSWTSKKGAPVEISPGMLGQLTITTAHRAPASYIIPAVREFLHGDHIKQQPAQEE